VVVVVGRKRVHRQGKGRRRRRGGDERRTTIRKVGQREGTGRTVEKKDRQKGTGKVGGRRNKEEARERDTFERGRGDRKKWKEEGRSGGGGGC
jgi:hypothetical protein